mgnify:CR=1 FL=1
MLTDDHTPKLISLVSTAIQESTDIEETTIEITLAPGEFYFGDANTCIHTLLGSCIAITLWHPLKRIGGMCHYLLPTRGDNQRLSHGHFADDAIQLFMKNLQLTGSYPNEYEVKLFGGGNMFVPLSEPGMGVNIAKQNIEAGMNLLIKHGFSINNSDVGGNTYRKIYLKLNNGEVWVKHGHTSFEQGELPHV